MLKVENLSRNYGDFKAVDGVKFSIEKGEIVGLLGHNGAGKSTIMKLICGYLEPDMGSISLDDCTLDSENRVAIQQQIGYLPENLPLYLDMPVVDYLDYIATIKRLTSVEKIAEIKRVTTATSIEDKLLQRIGTLSRGYRQRVGVAQALLGKPKLLVLDEPTNGLDPAQTEQMRQLIQDISRNATVILSTHIMQEVTALCHRVILIASGKLQIDESLENLQSSNTIQIGSNLTLTQLQKALSTLVTAGQISQINSRTSNHRYRITTDNSKDMTHLPAKIAKTIVEQGADLTELKTVSQDLEYLFKKSQ